jgi:hypothetical protein
MFENETGRPGVERPSRKGDVPVHREKHHRRPISALPQLRESVDA